MAGWFAFSLIDAFTKGMTDDFKTIQLIGMSSVTGTLLSAGWIVWRHGWRGFITPKWKLFALRGALVIPISYLIVHALAQVTLADFYGIIFMSPFLITILSVVVLKEKIGIHRIAAMIVGFTGVMILAGPQMQSAPLGLLCVFIAMIGGSIVAILIRKIGRVPATALFAFVPFISNALIYGPLMLLPGNFHIPENSWLLLEPAGMGVLAFAGFILFSIGFTSATETAVVAPFHYSQMLWGVLLGYLMFGDIPQKTTIAGSLIILSAGLYMLWREYLHHKINHSSSATIEASGEATLPET
ncbi:MAG: DMT family transporter [Micavibrio aeruginosavorus]|uniref:DMT family transporter n=1 Tax=Micavibrio aeruginosavorus TaxID=349221 RepID=A0A7T5R1V7_9BACT|nr:MAG: DMT family transporter [Micavibrio aeruginosavorus]